MSNEFVAYPEKIMDLADHSTFVAVLTKAIGRFRRHYSIDFRLNNDGLILAYAVWNHFLTKGDSEAGPENLVKDQLSDLKFVCQVLCLLLIEVHIIEEVNQWSHITRGRLQQIQSISSEFFSVLLTYECYRHFAYKITGGWPPSWFATHSLEDFIELCNAIRETRDVKSAFNQMI